MITRTMGPFTPRRKVQKDIFDNIVPYLRRNRDSKTRRAIIESHYLPMIFNPIHYFNKATNNGWSIYCYAINKKSSKSVACIAASEVRTEEGTCIYEYIIAGEHNIYIFPPHFFPRYHSRFVKGTGISRQGLINQYIKNSYLGIMRVPGLGQNTCAISFQDECAIDDIISRREYIYILKTFTSKDLSRKGQMFTEIYDIIREQGLLNYIVNLGNPHEFLINQYGHSLDSKLQNKMGKP